MRLHPMTHAVTSHRVRTRGVGAPLGDRMIHMTVDPCVVTLVFPTSTCMHMILLHEMHGPPFVKSAGLMIHTLNQHAISHILLIRSCLLARVCVGIALRHALSLLKSLALTPTHYRTLRSLSASIHDSLTTLIETASSLSKSSHSASDRSWPCSRPRRRLGCSCIYLARPCISLTFTLHYTACMYVCPYLLSFLCIHVCCAEKVLPAVVPSGVIMRSMREQRQLYV